MALTASPPAEPAEAAGVTKSPAPQAATDAAGLGRARASVFVAPALALIAAFLVFPALWTLYLGITNYRLTGVAALRPRVVGLDNYARALGDPEFLNSLWLTLLFVIGSAVIGQCVLGFVLAWTLRAVPRTVRTVVELLVMLAWILPSSVVAFLWIALLDRDGGTLNVLLNTPGMAWLIEYPMLSVIIFNAWRGTAFSMLLFSAALNGIPPSQLETARMVGASGWQQLRDVVLPHVRGHILTNLLLISLWTFNDFSPFLITAGGPNGRSETLPVFVYNTAIPGGQLGFGSAVSLLMLLINLVLAVVYLRLLKQRRA